MSVDPALDHANADFWNELCGSNLARSLGIIDHSQGSLRRFDQAYFDFYPYLLKYLRPESMTGARVIEIGLGYGSLAQRIIEAGASYIGIDIAEGPVDMLAKRLSMTRPAVAAAIRASAVALPVASESVDYVVAIGCFHHTGNLKQCVAEAHRVLKPSGTAIVMVYNRFSYRQWVRWPVRTMAASLSDGTHSTGQSDPDQRRAYDADTGGRAAPETVFVSVRQLRRLFAAFDDVEISKENNDNILRVLPRRFFLSTVGRTLGLDLYVRARKRAPGGA